MKYIRGLMWVFVIVTWSMLISYVSDIYQFDGIDPAVQEHVDLFSKLTGKKPEVNLGFIKEPHSELTIGTCYYGIPGKPQVHLLKSYWDKADYVDRVTLVFHELAHCLCEADHNEKVLTDGCPYSIMYPTTFSRRCLNKHADHYIMELQSICK